MLTKEEYLKKLDEIRKERDFHHNEYLRLMEEMDRLESDQKQVDNIVGKYIVIDKINEDGYKDYFHVHTYDKRPRGVTLYGKGFNINSKGDYIHISDTYFLKWDELDKIEEIHSEDFHDVFDQYINTVKFNLINFTQHHDLGNQFKFKNNLVRGKVKATWIDNILNN